MQMARRTNDRYRDIPDGVRSAVVEWLRQHDSPSHLCELVEQGGSLDQEEQQRAFGEALPKGLQIR